MGTFKGTKGKWLFHDSQTAPYTTTEDYRPIGITFHGSKESRYNELLRSKAPELLTELEHAKELLKALGSLHLKDRVKIIEKLIKEATEL